MQYPNSYKTYDGDYISGSRTLATLLVRRWYVTHVAAALLLIVVTFDVLAQPVLWKVALEGSFAGLSQAYVQHTFTGNDEVISRFTDALLFFAACSIWPKSNCALNLLFTRIIEVFGN